MDAGAQAKALKQGVDIVTGTPGRRAGAGRAEKGPTRRGQRHPSSRRVWDFVESGKLSTDQVRFFVLDEADRLLDTGNLELILKLFQRFPKGGEGLHRLQVLMFSATLHSPEIRQLSEKICLNPIWVDLKGKDSVPDTVDHVMVVVDPREDRSWLQSQARAPACPPPPPPPFFFLLV